MCVCVIFRERCTAEMFSLCQSKKELSIFSLKVVGDNESDFFISKSLFTVEQLLSGCLKNTQH